MVTPPSILTGEINDLLSELSLFLFYPFNPLTEGDDISLCSLEREGETPEVKDLFLLMAGEALSF